MRKILTTAVLSAAVLGGLAATAGPALAGTTPGAVYAVTHSAQHTDTTVGGLPGTACGAGPSWAIDNLNEHFTVTPFGSGEYKVVIDVGGSFAGFADPNTCNALTSNGPVKGAITYYVLSSTPPSPASLLPNQAPDTGLGAALAQLFPGFTGYDWAPADAGAYTFSYQNGLYVQNTSGTTGSIRGA